MDNKLHVSFELSPYELQTLGVGLESYVRNRINAMLANKLQEIGIDMERRMYQYSRGEFFRASINIFTGEQLKQHDQDVIEEFCSRES